MGRREKKKIAFCFLIEGFRSTWRWAQRKRASSRESLDDTKEPYRH